MDTLHRVFTDLVGRLPEPLHLRAAYAACDGRLLWYPRRLKDAREGQPAYFWSLFTDSEHRKERLKTGFRAVAKVLAFALILDAIYQFIALRWFYPGEAIIVALELAFVPYLLIRGPAKRIAGWWMSRHASTQPEPGTSR